MKKSRRVSSDFQEHCQSVHEDDGIDPRRYFRSEVINGAGSKCHRFCGHVAKVLNVVLGSCGNPMLGRLFVVKVIPAPTLSRLEVVIDAAQVDSYVTDNAIRMEIDRASSHLRTEIGRAIARKYVPDLVFRFASPDEVFQ